MTNVDLDIQISPEFEPFRLPILAYVSFLHRVVKTIKFPVNIAVSKEVLAIPHPQQPALLLYYITLIEEGEHKLPMIIVQFTNNNKISTVFYYEFKEAIKTWLKEFNQRINILTQLAKQQNDKILFKPIPCDLIFGIRARNTPTGVVFYVEFTTNNNVNDVTTIIGAYTSNEIYSILLGIENYLERVPDEVVSTSVNIVVKKPSKPSYVI